MSKDIELEIEQTTDTEQVEMLSEKAEVKSKKAKISLEQLRQSVKEDDDAPASTLTLRKILGGEMLSAQIVRSQIWLFMLIALFLTFYVAFRYQCQQDVIDIAQLENELTDAKYKALSSSSNLTERCRESQVLEMLLTNKDSTLHTSSQPPYKIYVREEE
jgi:hypothetical protein